MKRYRKSSIFFFFFFWGERGGGGGYFTCITKFFESEICVGCPLSLILLLLILAILREIGNHEDGLCLL